MKFAPLLFLSLHFAVLGDRTGEPRPGIYEQVWRETAAENPAFAVSVGDTIQGPPGEPEAEWRQIDRILAPFRRIPLYLAAGNHDVWSPESERLFLQHSGHPLHYSFDSGPVHVTVLDNSRSDQFPPGEMEFLAGDLKAHAAQPVKFIVSHRPGWLINVAMRNTDFPLHRLAKQYGVHYVIAGHLHQMLHFQLDGVTYVSMPSAGGHLRVSEQYQDGWFFGHALVEVDGANVHFRIEEVKPPHGQGRTTSLADWGIDGLALKGH